MKNFKKIAAILGVIVLLAVCCLPMIFAFGSGENAQTFPTWDGSNPDVSVYLEARRKGSSDSDSYSFEPMSNSDIGNHLGKVRAGIFIITVDNSGKVSVTSKTAER